MSAAEPDSTERQLREVILRADPPGLVRLLAPLDEPTRATLAPVAAAAYAEAKREHDTLLYGPPGRDTRNMLTRANRFREQQQVAALAWLGTGDLADMPPPREPGDPDFSERFAFEYAFQYEELHQILLDRRPAWLPALVDQYTADCHWDEAWRLVMDGAVARPAGPAYLRSMAAHAGWGWDPGLAAMARRDPRLLGEDLPALLDLPDGMSLIVQRDTRPAVATRTWLPVLLEHFPAGHPIRDRLLDHVLGRLAGDLPGPEASRLYAYLDEIGPTPEELAARRRTLYALAAHRLPGVVGHAVRLLARLGRDGVLPPAELVDAAAPALLAPTKSTAAAALGVVTAAVRRDPGCEPAAVTAYMTALGHPHADVQRAALDAVAPHLARYPEAQVRLRELLPELSVTAAERLPAILPQRSDPPPAAAVADLDEALRRAGKQPPDVARDCGLEAAVQAVRRGAQPPAVTVRPWAGARRDGIPPVSTVEELVEVLLRAVEDTASTVDRERALDGLATVGPQWPVEFGRLVGPLVRRVNQRLDRDTPDWGDQPATDFCLLVASWMEPDRGGGPAEQPSSAYGWLAARIREVALGLGDRDARPLLALPTDARGWLDPAVLVDRAAAMDGTIRRPVDTAVALMRLCPPGREAALAAAAGLPGPLGRAVRAALGGEDDPSDLPEPVPTAIGWLRGRGAGRPPGFGREQEVPVPRESYRELFARTLAQPPSTTERDGVLVYDWSHLPEWQDANARFACERAQGYAPGWAATLWPGDRRWLWRDEVAARAALRLLLDPDEPVPVEALGATLGQLRCDTAEERALAADVLIQAIGDGRVTGTELTHALRVACDEASEIHSGRIVGLLEETAEASVLHRAVVRAALLTVLPAWLDQLPARQVYRPLALLDTACAADGTPVPAGRLRTVLEPLATGRSKSATVSRRLLTRTPYPDAPASGDAGWPAGALVAALQARIDRAERRP